jgi:uncharacterized membrane protein YqiK
MQAAPDPALLRNWSMTVTTAVIAGVALVLLVLLIDHVRIVDLRVITLEVPQQEVITSDNVTVKVTATEPRSLQVHDHLAHVFAGKEADERRHGLLDA